MQFPSASGHRRIAQVDAGMFVGMANDRAAPTGMSSASSNVGENTTVPRTRRQASLWGAESPKNGSLKTKAPTSQRIFSI